MAAAQAQSHDARTGLVHYDAMCQAIDAAYEIDEVKEIRDKAMALEVVRLSHKPPPKTLAELGISKRQSSDWQKLAAVPHEQFEAAFATNKRPSIDEITGKPKPGHRGKLQQLHGRLGKLSNDWCMGRTAQRRGLPQLRQGRRSQRPRHDRQELPS